MASVSAPPPSTPASSSQARQQSPEVSAVNRLLIAPLTFISFILSLTLVANRDSSIRHHIHTASYQGNAPSVYERLKGAIHAWMYQPNPYAYVKSPEVLKREGRGGNGNSVATADEPWHWHSRQRQMSRMEITDAFKLRQRVVLAMLMTGVGIILGISYVLKWSYGMFWGNA